MKMPKLPKMPKFALPNRLKKLRASTAAARRAPVADDYYEDEPKTNLSSAFVVVLILHVVAVGGIYTFNSIRAARRGQEPAAARTATAENPAPQQRTAAADPVAEHPAPVAQPPAKGALKPVVAPVPALAKASPVTSVRPAETGAAPNTGAALKASGKTYTVAKGDTPTAIARKLGTSTEELLKLNKIEDPKKLQPGQTLKVPAKKVN